MTLLAGVLALVATAARILAQDPLFRLGIATNLVAAACYIGAALLVYDLLKPVSRNLSLLAAGFSFTGCAVGALSFLFRLVPLLVLGRAQDLPVFIAAPLRALAHWFLGLEEQASIVCFALFGLYCLLVGCLILRSAFLSHAVGMLMACSGLAWLTHSLATFLSPPLGHSLLTGILGAGSLTMWLLVIGVNVQRWKEQAGAPLGASINR